MPTHCIADRLLPTLGCILLFSTFLAGKVYAQTGPTISVYSIFPSQGSMHGKSNGYNYNLIDAAIVGGDLGYSFSRYFSLHVGFEWSQFNASSTAVDIPTPITGPPIEYTSVPMGYIDLLTIPVTAKFVLLKYIYVQGGLLWDTQTKNISYTQNSGTYGPLTAQSGLGAVIDVGATYPLFHALSVNAGFYNEFHGVHLTDNNNVSQKLYNEGLQLGLTVKL